MIAYGDEYLKEERVSDAVDFYDRAKYAEGLERIKELAIIQGDVMEFEHVLRALKQTASREEWERISQRASELGKFSFSLRASEMLKASENTNEPQPGKQAK